VFQTNTNIMEKVRRKQKRKEKEKKLKGVNKM
jgi:hypothetical protein